MPEIVRLVVDPNAPGSEQLMRELEKQLKALEIGTLQTRKEPPPEGTLAEPITIIIALQITYWSLKVAKAIIEIVRDTREKQAADLKQPVEQLAKVFMTIGEGKGDTLALPSSHKKEEEFLSKVVSELTK